MNDWPITIEEAAERWSRIDDIIPMAQAVDVMMMDRDALMAAAQKQGLIMRRAGRTILLFGRDLAELCLTIERDADWIYFVKAGESGPIKIGLAENVEKRIRDLQCANHEALSLLSVIKGNAAREHYLHRKFADNRIRGEWFQRAPVEEWLRKTGAVE